MPISLILIAVAIYVLLKGIGRDIFFDLIVSAIFIAMFPSGLISNIKERKTRKKEYQLTIFLDDLSEASKYAPNLAHCITGLANRDYGELTGDVSRIAERINYGATFEEALQDLGKKIDSPFVTKITATLIELNKTGGNISEVLTEISNMTKDAYLAKREKYAQLSSYAMVIFISFAVFLLAIALLEIQFFPAILKEGASSFSYLNPSAIPIVKEAFLGLVITNGVGGGIMAGILRSGSRSEGLIYASLLSIVGYIVIALVGGV
ncbi:MAG: type II secretion system F family protein [Thermoplasmatales archaeon]